VAAQGNVRNDIFSVWEETQIRIWKHFKNPNEDKNFSTRFLHCSHSFHTSHFALLILYDIRSFFNDNNSYIIPRREKSILWPYLLQHGQKGGEIYSVHRSLTGPSVGNHYDSDGLGSLHGNAQSKSRYLKFLSVWDWKISIQIKIFFFRIRDSLMTVLCPDAKTVCNMGIHWKFLYNILISEQYNKKYM
jgi:hypothetical protein